MIDEPGSCRLDPDDAGSSNIALGLVATDGGIPQRGLGGAMSRDGGQELRAVVFSLGIEANLKPRLTILDWMKRGRTCISIH